MGIKYVTTITELKDEPAVTGDQAFCLELKTRYEYSTIGLDYTETGTSIIASNVDTYGKWVGVSGRHVYDPSVQHALPLTTTTPEKVQAIVQLSSLVRPDNSQVFCQETSTTYQLFLYLPNVNVDGTSVINSLISGNSRWVGIRGRFIRNQIGKENESTLAPPAGGAVGSVNGKVGNVLLTTDDVPEGNNKYFADALARQALAAEIDLSNRQLLDSLGNANFQWGNYLTSNNTIHPVDPDSSDYYWTMMRVIASIEPTVSSYHQAYTTYQADIYIDPQQSGFDFGIDGNSGNSGVAAFSGSINHGANGRINYVNGLRLNLNFGSNSAPTGIANDVRVIANSIYVNNGYHIESVTELSLFSNFDTGSSLNNYAGIVLGPSFRATGSAQNIHLMDLYPQMYTPVSNGVNLINLSGNYYSSAQYTVDAQIGSQYRTGSNMGNVTGMNITPFVEPGANMQSFQLLNLSPNASTIMASQGPQAVVALNISLSSITTDLPKIGLNINDGQISSFSTRSTQSNLQFDQNNIIGDFLTIHAGSPITGTEYVSKNMVLLFSAEDDYTTGPLGIGVANLAAVGQTSVQAGKTVSRLSELALGSSVPAIPGDGGTVSEVFMARSFGIVSFGGNLVIDNLYHFGVVDSDLGPSIGTNQWGVFIDSDVHNYMSNNLTIGANTNPGKNATKKVSNPNHAIEITKPMAIKLEGYTTAARDAAFPLPGEGTIVYNSQTHTLQYFNGTLWVSL